MRIPVVFAVDNIGAAPNYTIKALQRLGHETRRMTPDEYFAADPNEYDLFWCQDSGEGIDFRRASDAHLKRTSMWYWDSRWNRVQRNPGDDDMARWVMEKGGWVFQAQSPDLDRFGYYTVPGNINDPRISWLPIAGDPFEWSNEPQSYQPIHKCSFVGNCYDSGRGSALNYARDTCQLFWPGPNSLFYKEAAKVYRDSWVCFHAPTFYNLPHDVTHERVDYDVTMRYFEAPLCGIPVVTPPMPDFEKLGFQDGFQIFIYNSLEEIPQQVNRAYMAMQDGLLTHELRSWVLGHHTYDIRLQYALNHLRDVGVLNA